MSSAKLFCVTVGNDRSKIRGAFESALSDGVMHERRLFNALFATADQKKSMDAFLNKRPAQFKNQ